MLVDGGIIANNPSLYAFIYAAEKHKKENIRVISIGCGAKVHPKLTPGQVSALTWLWNLGDLLVDVEVSAHSFFTEFLVSKSNYRRYQITIDKGDDATDKESIKVLKDLGEDLVKQNKDDIKATIKQIMDEKYGQ